MVSTASVRLTLARLGTRLSARALLRGLAIGCLVLGVALRFFHLSERSYTNDEATTSVRSAGGTLAQTGALYDGRVRTAAELARYQTIVPGTHASDVVRSLAVEDPQHPPLYYLAERGWIAVAGSSVQARRSLSAVAAVLALPVAIALGVELVGTLEAGLVLAALLALSPFQVIYAQQAREYALWTLLVLTAVWLLLRALRHGTVFAWIAFGIGLAATLYTDLLALLMLPGLALIVAANAQRKRAALVAWSAATAGAVIAYVPWLIAVVRGAGLLTNNGYLGSALPPLLFGTKWLFNAAAVFADFEYRHIALAVALIPLTLIVAFCVARVARNRRVASVIAALFVPGLVLLASDVVHHESRSTAARYLVPVWIGIDLLVAYGLTALLSDRWIRHRAVGAAAFAYLAVIGAVSSALDVHGTWTWADTSAAPLAPIAAAIDGAWAPYLVVREDPQQWRFTVFQLVNVVRPDVRVRMLHPSADIGAPPADATMLLLDPTRSALDEVRAAGLRVVPLYLEPSDPPGSDVAAFRARARATRELGGFHGAGESLWAVEPVTKR